MGKKIVALITDMEQPLGRTVGNALEIVECIETLQGKGPEDLEALSVELAAWMLSLAGAAPTLDAARGRVRDALASGDGLRKFQEVIALQGGDPRVCDDLSRLPRAKETVELRAESAGQVTAIGCRAVGTAAMLLGAGRETVESRIDPGVGLVLRKKVGDAVAAGDSLASVHVSDRRHLDEALAMLGRAIRVGPQAPPPRPLVHAVLQ
jgi:pyrimidine-nucleoside phosphorylase